MPVFAGLAILGLGVAEGVCGRLRWNAAGVRTGIVFAMALCGAAVQILPAVEYGRLSVRWVNSLNPVDWRSIVPYPVHQSMGWSPAELIFLIVPGSYESIVNPIVGIVPLALAAAALLAVPRRRERRYRSPDWRSARRFFRSRVSMYFTGCCMPLCPASRRRAPR